MLICAELFTVSFDLGFHRNLSPKMDRWLLVTGLAFPRASDGTISR
jgi:hypothetical protein